MKNLETQPLAHLFICCRKKEGKKSCCAPKGAHDIVDELKKWVKKNGLKKQIKVAESSCLGHCESGVTACLYPSNRWFDELTPEDVPKLKKLLLEQAKIDEPLG